MFRLAWRQLQLEPLRTVLTAIALGAVIGIILILEGFEQGQYFQLRLIVQNRRADLIAAQSGVGHFIATRSSIPQLSRQEIEAVDGVKNAHPMTSIPIIYEAGGIRTPVYILVFDTWGGPSKIIQGKGVADSKDIVIDRSLARKYGIRPGDPFIVSDFEFRVSGITDEAAFMMPFAFISYDGMIDLYLESEVAPDLSTFPLLSYMLIELNPSADRGSVAREIEARVSSVDVYTPGEMAANDVKMGRTFFRPIMGLLVTVTYVIGLLLVALLMYAEVRGRLRNFAVLKALGFSFGKLLTAVLLQTLLLFVVSLPVAVLTGEFISGSLRLLAPLYLIRFYEPSVLARTLAAGLVFAVIGVTIPMLLVRRTDPMIAFEEM